MSIHRIILPVATALTLLATTASSMARDKITVYRDRDGDGHYNKKTYEVPHYRSRGSYYGYSHGHGYGYRPYSYSPYRHHGYGYGYYGPSVGLGVSVYSRPTYTSRVYRGYAVRDSLASDVQSALRRRGYYYGPVDGDIGPGSRAAIRAYQRDRGLAVTGRIDSSLLRSLGIS